MKEIFPLRSVKSLTPVEMTKIFISLDDKLGIDFCHLDQSGEI